jgi:predicted ABC-type ATPase
MPQLWVVAGPNGAGKSTLANKYLAGRLPIVNPDVIAQALVPLEKS